MKHQKPDHLQPVDPPVLPTQLQGVPLRAPTERGSVDAFLELLVEIALSQCSADPVVQSSQPASHKKAA